MADGIAGATEDEESDKEEGLDERVQVLVVDTHLACDDMIRSR